MTKSNSSNRKKTPKEKNSKKEVKKLTMNTMVKSCYKYLQQKHTGKNEPSFLVKRRKEGRS